jgi:hypothetical protein
MDALTAESIKRQKLAGTDEERRRNLANRNAKKLSNDD